jgi:hypothetical protein
MKRVATLEAERPPPQYLFSHADLVHDMRLAVAHLLDPLSAYCYARVDKENFFLIVHNLPTFETLRECGDGESIGYMPQIFTWPRAAQAPMNMFVHIVKRHIGTSANNFHCCFTSLVLSHETASEEFQARFECLVAVAPQIRAGAKKLDCLRTAIAMGASDIAHYVAQRPDTMALGLARPATLREWHRRDNLGLSQILTSDLSMEKGYYQLVRETMGVTRFIDRFVNLLKEAGIERLVGVCTQLFLLLRMVKRGDLLPLFAASKFHQLRSVVPLYEKWAEDDRCVEKSSDKFGVPPDWPYLAIVQMGDYYARNLPYTSDSYKEYILARLL